MEILHVVTELSPFAKVGGLADVALSLSKQQKLLGHRVTLVIPHYPLLERAGLMLARRLTPLSFELGGVEQTAAVYDGKLATGVELVALGVDGFDREGVYGDDSGDYADNAQRFARFSGAAVELVKDRARAGQPPAIVHAHDWPTALVPYFSSKLDGAPPTVLTLHNLAHQGVVPRELAPALGLSPDDFHMGGYEFYGQANLLKAGIVTADAVTTVSETYARDILTPEGGMRLDGVLRARKEGSVVGIVNGVDSSVWNPATDTALASRYDVEDITNKARCKGALLGELGLDVKDGRPLAVFVGRLVEQKGADLLLAALPKLLASDVAVAIAGGGDPATMSELSRVAEVERGRVAFAPKASEALVHRLFAGADMALVPSRFEPCGLVQLYAQRYGALPIARATGGLRDTIVDCDAALETGTGFLFDDATPEALLGAVQRARTAYASPRWRALVRRVMRLDRGWERPARRYDQVYRALGARLVSPASRRERPPVRRARAERDLADGAVVHEPLFIGAGPERVIDGRAGEPRQRVGEPGRWAPRPLQLVEQLVRGAGRRVLVERGRAVHHPQPPVWPDQHGVAKQVGGDVVEREHALPVVRGARVRGRASVALPCRTSPPRGLDAVAGLDDLAVGQAHDRRRDAPRRIVREGRELGRRQHRKQRRAGVGARGGDRHDVDAGDPGQPVEGELRAVPRGTRRRRGKPQHTRAAARSLVERRERARASQLGERAGGERALVAGGHPRRARRQELGWCVRRRGRAARRRVCRRVGRHASPLARREREEQ